MCSPFIRRKKFYYKTDFKIKDWRISLKPWISLVNPFLSSSQLILIPQFQFQEVTLWFLPNGMRIYRGYNVICIRLWLPTHSVVFEELLEVITCAVIKLSLDWPDEKFTVVQSKLDDYYLTSWHIPLTCRRLPFFPGLHTVVLRSWNNPYSAHLFSLVTTNYSAIVGLDRHKYATMSRVEEILGSYLLHLISTAHNDGFAGIPMAHL